MKQSSYSIGLVALVISFGMSILWIILMRSPLHSNNCDCHPVFKIRSSSNGILHENMPDKGINKSESDSLNVNKIYERKLGKDAESGKMYLPNNSYSNSRDIKSFNKHGDTIVLNKTVNRQENLWSKYESCPENIKISILGDSTGFRTHKAMLGILGCKMIKKEILGGKGHLPGIKYFSRSGNKDVGQFRLTQCLFAYLSKSICGV